MADPPFEPKLGRGKSAKASPNLRFSRAVIQQAYKSGSLKKTRLGSSGPRFGRGNGPGGLLQARSFTPGQRRVVVKAHFVRHRNAALSAAKAHLAYVQRDGVTREDTPGELYDRKSDCADGKAFLVRSHGERHQFRLIVAPEDSAKLEGLKPYIRDLMGRLEKDLGTRLDWVAVDHHNTGHPHTHVIIGGRADDGRDLVIAKSYISYGVRARAQEGMTLELGPESMMERLEKAGHETQSRSLTRLDRAILLEAKAHIWAIPDSKNRDTNILALKIDRLKVLTRLGLATERRAGVFQLDPGMTGKLATLGARQENYAAIERHLKAAGLSVEPSRMSVFNQDTNTPATGNVIGTGLSDRGDDRHYAVLQEPSGKVLYAEFRLLQGQQPPSLGATVSLSALPQRGQEQALAKVSVLSPARGIGRSV